MDFSYLFTGIIISIIIVGVLTIKDVINKSKGRSAAIKIVKPTVTDLNEIKTNKENYTICGLCVEYNLKSNKRCWKCEGKLPSVTDMIFEEILQEDIKKKRMKYKLNLKDLYMVKKRVK